MLIFPMREAAIGKQAVKDRKLNNLYKFVGWVSRPCFLDGLSRPSHEFQNIQKNWNKLPKLTFEINTIHLDIY